MLARWRNKSRKLTSFGRSGRAISASAIQSWATCGYKYFLERVIAVEPTNRPDDSPTIDPLQRGSLIHECWKSSTKGWASAGRPDVGESYRPEDYERLRDIATEYFGVLERAD